MAETWTGTTWFIESDISDCFGSLDHQVMLATVSENIHDNRFLRLLRDMLTAGYLEDWVYNATLSGVPQGGVASPILSNIYLHQLDMFVENVLIPDYTRGTRRAGNPAYQRVQYAIRRARKRGDRCEVRSLGKQLRSLPSQDPSDPGYRRLHYVRYADDALLGFIGPRAEAEQIKSRLAAFLADDLALELSTDKTLITHARMGAAKFLGYEITVQHNDRQGRGRRTVNGTIGLRVPRSVIKAKCAPHLKRGEPACRTSLVNEDDHTIVATFGAEYRGIIQYYLLAGDVHRLSRLRWVMESSMLKTLAGKYGSTAAKMARKYKATIDTPDGPRTCFQATVERSGGRKPLVTRFGGIPLRRQKNAVLTDRATVPVARGKELIKRLLTGKCEICKQAEDIQVHHIRKLADLAATGLSHQPAWASVMAKRQRKTLVVCRACHATIHAGRPAPPLTQ